MQNSTPAGNRVSTHTLKTQDKVVFFFKQKVCVHQLSVFIFYALFFLLDFFPFGFYAMKFCQEHKKKAMVLQ